MDKFDGSEDVEDFIFKFKYRARTHAWNDATQVDLLKMLCTGVALEAISSVADDKKDKPDELIKALETSCAKKAREYRLDFTRAKKKKDESYENYGIRLKHIGTKAFSRLTADEIEEVVIEKIVESLPDDLKPTIIAKEFKQSRDATKLISKIMEGRSYESEENVNVKEEPIEANKAFARNFEERRSNDSRA